jgi:hypothetical protein
MEKVRVEPPYIKTKNVQSAAIQLIKNYLGWSIEIIKKELRDIHTTLDKTGAYVSVEAKRDYQSTLNKKRLLDQKD